MRDALEEGLRPTHADRQAVDAEADSKGRDQRVHGQAGDEESVDKPDRKAGGDRDDDRQNAGKMRLLDESVALDCGEADDVAQGHVEPPTAIGKSSPSERQASTDCSWRIDVKFPRVAKVEGSSAEKIPMMVIRIQSRPKRSR